MNELILSDNLKQIELEINHHKNIAGQSIWEIGRRLNHVKENDLAHGNFIKWVESNLKIDIREAQRFMKVASELPNTDTWSHLGGRALYLISTLPEEERTKEHVTEKGETKTPDEMTTRELQELKKQINQQAEQHQRQLAQKDEVINKTYEQLEKAQQQEPKVVEKEVIPEDYEKIKQENEQLKQSNQKLQRDLKWVQDDLRLKQMQYQLLESSTAEAKALKKQIDSLKNEQNNLTGAIEATRDLHQLERDFNDFFDKNMAPIKFKGISQYIGATNAPARIHNLINLAEAWVEEMRKAIPNQNIKIIEGEIIDD